MAGLTDADIREIDRANAADTRAAVFIHGPGKTEGWDAWRPLFDDNGYVSVTSGWSADPTLVDTARTEPDALAASMVQTVTEYYLELIGRLSYPPVVIGHGFGGLIAQRLASEGVAAATVAIASWPIAGVPASTLGTSESTFFATEDIATLDTATVDPTRTGRGPLLLVAGADDSTIPAAASDAAYALQSENPDVTEYTVIPGRDHSLAFGDGWREVADTVLVFAQNYAAPKQH